MGFGSNRAPKQQSVIASRSRRQAELPHQRLDIQGLRMVAVLFVFATHLFGWPRGGFIGVDVFFVISGFLITGSLLRTAERTGNVSFRKFYWNRARRIVPAATIVLIVTYLTSVLVFLPFRAQQVGVDAFFALIFMSNWRFGSQETDYFAAGDAVSPIQHYWSLSIEEQFYFFWPALIFVIGLIAARRALPHTHQLRLTGTVMGGIIAISLGWAIYETASSPTLAYFNTFSRVWELGVGALLATSVGVMARIPLHVRTSLSWGGFSLILASVFLIGEGSASFPAPWALLPVTGSAMVIAAGIGGEPAGQSFLLSNQAAVYVGNISYSLYLVHWPVIVILAALMTPAGGSFYLAAVALSFALAIASYHFVENPLRYGSIQEAKQTFNDILRRRFRPKQGTVYAALAALTLLVAGSTAFAMRPLSNADGPPQSAAPQNDLAAQKRPQPLGSGGPLATALQEEIVKALTAVAWPNLDPSMDSVITGPEATPEIGRCGGNTIPDPQACTWGSPNASTRVMLVGDSIALSYGGPLRELALNSAGAIQLRVEAMSGCQFVSDHIKNSDPSITELCPSRKQHTVDVINATKPDVVIISNSYGAKPLGDGRSLAPGQWANSMQMIVDKFRANTKKIVFLSAPPGNREMSECYGTRSSIPADCVGEVTSQWISMAQDEQDVAESLGVGAVWIDSSPWFCSGDGLCPAFVGSTPTKHDQAHMSPAYGQKIYPVIGESLTGAGAIQ